MARPCCAWCDKPLRYWTSTVNFEVEGDNKAPLLPGTVRLPANKIPTTREEAKAYTNQTIVSVKRGWPLAGKLGSVAVWDGESYLGYPRNGKAGEAAIFCTAKCAIYFATAAYRGGARRLRQQPQGKDTP